MTTPTLKVEIAFDDDPLTVSPTWTDVTAYVRDSPGVQISRGRPTELDTFTPGRCSFTLDNNDGEFSPLNSGSSLAGKLLPGKQVRVTATYSSTDYRLFRGFITGWPQRYAEGKRDAIVPILAFDALSKLNEIEIMSLTDSAILDTGGDHYLMLRGLDGRRWRDVGVVNRPTFLMAGTAVETGTLIEGIDSTAVQFANARMSVGPNTLMPGTVTGDFYNISFVVSTTSAGSSSSIWMDIVSNYLDVTGNGSHIGIDSAGLLRVSFGLSGTYSTAQSKQPINDGAPHYVTVNQFFGDLVIYIDGQDATDYTTGYVDGGSDIGDFVRFIGSDPAGAHLRFTGTLQDLACNESAGDNRVYLGTYRETTADVIGTALDLAGWPSALRSIATNTQGVCGSSWGSGSSALAACQQVAATEQGRFFASREGNITLLSRYSHQLDTTGNTSQHTFSDDGADSDYVDVGFDYDDTQVRNDITVSSPAGTGQAEDATSITAYGRQSASVSTFLATGPLAQDMADGLVGWRKDPQVRSLPLTSYPQTDPAQWPSVLALELGQRVTFEITPPGVGSQVATQLILEQMDWNITIAAWELTVQASPVPPSIAIFDVDSYDDGCVYGF